MKNRKARGFALVQLLFIIVIIAIGGLAWFAFNHAAKIEKAERVDREGIHAADAAVQNIFPEEKILTISAAEYCESVEKKLSDYSMVGVINGWSYAGFQKSVPAGTEVVAAFCTQPGGNFTGTALIPKDR